MPQVGAVDMIADVNRDGVVDAYDNEGEAVFTAQVGTSFLPNVDDDDQDGQVDALTPLVDGEGDEYDLTKIVVVPWELIPDDATGRFTLNADAVPHVRVYKTQRAEAVGARVDALVGSPAGPQGWELVGGEGAGDRFELTAEEIRNGVVLGVEGMRLAGLPDSVGWSGLLDLTYGVYEDGSSEPMQVDESNEDGLDRMQLRVAPWVMFGNTTPRLDLVFANRTGDNDAYIDSITEATGNDDVAFWVIDDWQDRWTEDWMQTGYVSRAFGENVVGMRMTMPRPWGRGSQFSSLPINWLEDRLIAPDTGVFVTYDEPGGTTYDSHGNHDLVPAYGPYPYGRIIYGSGVREDTKTFYEAQRVQAPAISVNTSWLIVGHVDEVFSYLPADTERGWKLLVGSPDLARQMLEDWSADGHGSAVVHEGLFWPGSGAADITIDELLDDTGIMVDSQEAQAEIDSMLATMVEALGLAEDEIIEIPFMFEGEGSQGLVAYNPGTVNSLVFNNSIVIPDPFGPTIDGVDGFKADLERRLGTPELGLGRDGQGMAVYFADDWYPYHVNLGEVHCGTNIWGPPQVDIKWWEVER